MSDIKLIHTHGLDEGIRCAMCTNVRANHKGCDGLCKVDKEMYKEVMSVIDEAFDKQPTVEMAEDCVKREDAQDIMARLLSDYLHDEDREKIENANAEIGELPSVQPQPKRGKWIVIRKEYEFMGGVVNEPQGCKCSNCGGIVKFKSDFCPNCGADMRECEKE